MAGIFAAFSAAVAAFSCAASAFNSAVSWARVGERVEPAGRCPDAGLVVAIVFGVVVSAW